MKDGFLQTELDEESSRLTTFQTTWGRHRWLRMLYGISPAPEYFQQKLDQNLQGLTRIYRITQAPVLKYFSPQAQTEGQGDASQNGLGFVLLQEGQPVTYARRALTPVEQRYSQIEKELPAQLFGLERHHHYTSGRRVILWTDHKPLVSIYKKPLASAPKRLQRLLLRLQQYDVDLRYKPGSEMYLADTLSRAFLKSAI